jgi:hypothetical protein
MGLIGILLGFLGALLGMVLGFGGALLGMALAFAPLSPFILVIILIVLLARASARNAQYRPDPRWAATPNQGQPGAVKPAGLGPRDTDHI